MSDYQHIKHIHFIRHGETLANRRSVHQGLEEPLSPKGRGEVKEILPTLREFQIDTLLSSPLTRARETAEIIGTGLNLPISYVEEAVEFARPNYLYGHSHYSLLSLFYVARLYFNQKNPDWNDDGAENLFRIRQRITSLRHRLETCPGNNILLVSHSIFMDMFATAVCADRELKLSEFTSGLLMKKRIPNTGIISFKVDTNAPGNTCRWWNISEV